MAEFDRRPLAPMVDEAHSLAQNTRSLALSTCRKYLAVGSFDRTIAIFDVASRKVFRRFGEGHLPSRARFRGGRCFARPASSRRWSSRPTR